MVAPAASVSPPFDRGQTWFGGDSNRVETTQSAYLEGMEWVFDDLDLTSTPNFRVARTHQKVRCRIVRNASGIALLPKRLAKFKTSGIYGNQVDGYAIASAASMPDKGYPIDEWLPSTGVISNDLFWLVMEGPAMVITTLAALTISISVGDGVVAATAATSQATTAGRVFGQDFVSSGATNGITLAANLQNAVGRAMSAATTSETNSSILVNVGRL